MKRVDKQFVVYSMDRDKTEIIEEYQYETKSGAMDMAYRLAKYSPKVFIREENTYEYDEEGVI